MSNRSEIPNYVNNFKKIWDNRNILIIEGEKTRLGIGNDLFDNAKKIERITCPAEHAFNSYEKILSYIKKLKLDKDTLILISLGPTATVLTYDICDMGNQVIDFGHFDIEYELYLRNATEVIKIPNKYVNEVNDGRKNISDITDKKYYDQIIYNIT
jgi:glycosyltransferase family protein